MRHSFSGKYKAEFIVYTENPYTHEWPIHELDFDEAQVTAARYRDILCKVQGVDVFLDSILENTPEGFKVVKKFDRLDDIETPNPE